MKTNIIRGILLMLLLCTFVVIFGFSSQNSEQSGGISKKIANYICDKIPGLKIQDEGNVINQLEKIIRKIAHFSIYTLVGFLIMSYIYTYNISNITKFYSSFLLGTLYAISDELHQSFVPGRSCQVTDVILDSMGVLFGILLIILIIKIKNKKYKFKLEN